MTKGQGEAESLVFVVDDDASVRQALTSLLQSVALREAFGSAADFLKKGRLADSVAAACLILDIRLPGVSGLDFQAELAKADTHLPIIFISGYGDIPMTVRAMKAGAIEFLTKPFRDQDLLDAVQLALQRDRDRRIQERAVLQTRARFEALTLREQEVDGCAFRLCDPTPMLDRPGGHLWVGARAKIVCFSAVDLSQRVRT